MRILLIQQPFRQLKRALEGQGHLIETGGLKDDAIDQKARSADLILLDLDTAGRDGLPRLKTWRKSAIAAHVLVLASRRGPEEKVDALDSGADGFVAKPYHRDELLAQVRALLRRVPAEERSNLRILDLELFRADRLVRRAGQLIKLTRREYDLLNLLASNCGKVVTRAQIWAHLSGRGDEANSNLIDVYIRYLRKKIDAGFDVPLILTCWGEGYRLRRDSELEAAG